MASSSMLGNYLWGMLTQAPLLIIYAIGVIIAITNMGRYRKPATLVLVAMLLFLFRTIVFNSLMIWVPQLVGYDNSWFAIIFMGINFVGAFLEAAGIVMLVIAAFIARQESRAASLPNG